MKLHFSGINKPPVHEETWTSFHKKYGTKKVSGRPSPAKSSPSRRNVKARSVHIASLANPRDDYRSHERQLNAQLMHPPRVEPRKTKNGFDFLHNLSRVFQRQGANEQNGGAVKSTNK